MKTAVHENKSKSFIPFLILIKVHKHKQTGISFFGFFLLSQPVSQQSKHKN